MFLDSLSHFYLIRYVFQHFSLFLEQKELPYLWLKNQEKRKIYIETYI